MTRDPTAPGSAKSRLKFYKKRAFLIPATMVVLMVVWTVTVRLDQELLDDSDLRVPEPSFVSPGDNALTPILAAVDSDRDWEKDALLGFSDEYDSEDAMWQHIERFVRQTRSLSTALTHASSLPAMQFSPIDVLDSELRPGNTALRELQYAVEWECWLLTHRGQIDAAIDKAKRLVEVALRGTKNARCALDYLICDAIVESTLTNLWKMCRTHTDAATMIDVAVWLQSLDIDRKTYRTALLNEYRLYSSHLAQVAAEHEPRGLVRLTFRPNETRNRLADRFREIARSLDDVPFPQIPDVSEYNPWTCLLRGNVFGKHLVDLIASDVIRTSRRAWQSERNASLTVVAFALRWYELEHGDLPQDLAALLSAPMCPISPREFPGLYYSHDEGWVGYYQPEPCHLEWAQERWTGDDRTVHGQPRYSGLVLTYWDSRFITE